jgi:hypothetical protein
LRFTYSAFPCHGKRTAVIASLAVQNGKLEAAARVAERLVVAGTSRSPRVILRGWY